MKGIWCEYLSLGVLQLGPLSLWLSEQTSVASPPLVSAARPQTPAASPRTSAEDCGDDEEQRD